MSTYQYNKALCQAAQVGDVKALKNSIDQGADPNYDNGLPLYMAAFHNQLECFKILLEQGALLSNQNYVALSEAARQGHQEVLSYIMAHHEIPMIRLIECVNEALYANQQAAAQLLAQQNMNYIVSMISVAQHMGINFKTIEFLKEKKINQIF